MTRTQVIGLATILCVLILARIGCNAHDTQINKTTDAEIQHYDSLGRQLEQVREKADRLEREIKRDSTKANNKHNGKKKSTATTKHKPTERSFLDEDIDDGRN